MLEGCRIEGKVEAKKSLRGICEFTRRMTDSKGHFCLVTDRFSPTKDSIRWEVDVTSEGPSWTTPMEMRLRLPSTEKTRFWTSWIGGNQWDDPLKLMSVADHTWNYGNGANTICIPLASILEPATDTGVSLVVSPDQSLLGLQLSTTHDGRMFFRYKFMRFGGGKKVMFVADIVAHEADWRGGLRWMVSRYPEYFNPPNPRADVLAGTGSYSGRMEKLKPDETARLKKMAYNCDWDASFNWPYFGMFLPPMPDAGTAWTTYGYNSAGNHDPGRSTQMSYRKLNEKARERKESGFTTLAYFNVTEFGVGIKDKTAVKNDLPDSESWHDANTYLYRKIADGILRDGNENTAGTWGGAIAMDSGGPDYQRSLLDQARRMELQPDFDGIAIDRMDWLSRVNYAPGADDQTGWYLNGRPGRFLGLSWINTLSKLGPIMHKRDKVIFVNCCLTGHRLDYMREVDGFYDEYGDNGYSLNGSSLLALRKPALMWTHDAGCIKPDPDSYFQRHLYMGAYPTAPFPGNDHTILPNPKTDQYDLDYGPLLDAMRGKKWVLEPHCVEVMDPQAKVNLFKVPNGYVVPVTFGGKAESVDVVLRNVKGITPKTVCTVLHPGAETPVPVTVRLDGGTIRLTVPLHRGCAMVRLEVGR